MKAYELGGVGLDRLVMTERPDPKPGPGEVLVRMRAAGINARDAQVIAGHYPVAKGYPLVPLSDGVGEVLATGPGVLRVHRGERVVTTFAQRWLAGPRSPDTWTSTLGADLDGVLQEMVVLREEGVLHVPHHLTDEEAATLTCAGVSAWQALVTEGHLRAGQTVLVQGTGAVSLFALQFAKLCGARVIATSADPNKRARVKALGASDVVDRTPDWPGRVRELTRGEGVDHVVDVSGDLAGSLACLRVGGIISVVGYLSSMRLEADIVPLMLANAHLHGISVGPRHTFEEMNRAISLHRLHPVVANVVPFDRAPQAFAEFAKPDRLGKIIVKF
jgi:NADPH:quinone reductase-like Zn-dependent oxidoreductase